MDNWIPRQVELKTAQFDRAVKIHYPENAHFFEDPKEFHRGLTELWNYLEAVKGLAWEKHLPAGALCLDWGSGTGWLSAFLSKRPKVAKVYALDSSRFFQNTMRPGMESLLAAESAKIIPIEGFFTPILLPDKALDLVVASSALHHADQLEEALAEAHRVLKDDGALFILNELPHGNLKYFYVLVKAFLAIIGRTLFRKYCRVSRAISSSGVLDDPFLGDRRYPYWYWERAIANAGFEVTALHRTGLATQRAERPGMELVHFICRKRKS